MFRKHFNKDNPFTISVSEFLWVGVRVRVMDSTNFIDFIRDSDDKEAEFHGWQRLPEAEEKEDEASKPIILYN